MTDLKNLSQLANNRLEHVGAELKTESFDNLLLRQEEQICSPLGSSNGVASIPVNENIHGQIELLSVKLFHESMRHSKIDQIIEKAIDTWPENPGPHNPHMLAIKAMVRMRTLSPQYLRRLSAYIETLLFLQKNANRVDDSKSFPQS